MEAYLFSRRKIGENPVKLMATGAEIIGASGQKLFSLRDSTLIEQIFPTEIADLTQVAEQKIALTTGEQWSIWQLTGLKWQELVSQREAGENFTAIAYGQELLAVSAGSRFYLYHLRDSRPELWAIRETCGEIKRLLFWQPQAELNFLAVLAENLQGNCLEIFSLTENGLRVLDFRAELPAKSEVLAQFREELLLGGGDGRVRSYAWEAGKLQEVLISEVLGTRITALAAQAEHWAAGTPGGYLFIFAPEQNQPESFIEFEAAISGLNWLTKERIAVGLGNGYLELAYWYPPSDFYTVREADTLWSIAQALGLELKDLMIRNGLEDGSIYPGQILRLRD